MPRGIYLRKRESVEERFWAKVQKTESCWIWSAGTSIGGYGDFSVTHSIKVPAHRFSWEFTYGPIPAGISVLHSCDNPPCVNPEHLFLGTKGDNNRDRAQKGRSKGVFFKGSLHRNAKLTEDAVLDIRRRYAAGGIYQRELANEYGVTRFAIGEIVNRVNWTHI